MKLSLDPMELLKEHRRLVRRLSECHPNEIKEELELQSKELSKLEMFIKKQKLEESNG